MTATCVAPAPLGAEEQPWLNLFNRRDFAASRVDPERHLVVTAHDPAGRPIGSVAGVRDGMEFVSGYSAPFGGVDLARERETPENVAVLVAMLLREIERNAFRSVTIKLAPACYGENQPIVLYTLLNHGFSVARTELNQHLDLSGLHDVDGWVAGLRRPALKALTHGLREDHRLEVCDSDIDVAESYALLAANRARKGRQLSLSLDYVLDLRRRLRPHVQMLRLRVEGTPLAAALVYDVAPRRRLVVAWGDADHGRAVSPMPLLAHGLVDRALGDGIHTLDLGVSNHPVPDPVAGLLPDAGLVQFKRGLGARTEPRFTLTKDLQA